MAEKISYDATDRALERALVANFLVHGIALLGMVTLLIPMLPGGSATDDAHRIAMIAAHPWRFRVGWLPWQLCAAADLAMAITMVRARYLPRAGAWFVLLFTMLAVAPDQYAQALWITRGVELAQSSDAAAYLAFEHEIFPLTAGWGALFYTVAALGWTYCFARAGTWSRALSILSVPLWLSMIVAVTAPLLPAGIRPSADFVSVANAIGFLQLQLWLGLVTEQVLRRARPFEKYGRLAPWKYPSAPLFARAIDAFANSRLFGLLLEPIPEIEMRSDIEDVVYVNYLVPSRAAEAMVPPGLELQRLGPAGAYALFTFLTYKHGHFGFGFLGPLRRLLPSPIQTNWRVHVVDPVTGHRGITFVTNAVTSVIASLGARMTTEGMPMHVLHRASITRVDKEIRVSLDPGRGTAPDAEIVVRTRDEAPALSGAWKACFPDFRAFLEYAVPQDRAMSSQPLRGRLSRQEINLGIPIDACVPLEGEVVSASARAIAGEAEPLCFFVPKVSFKFSIEAHDQRPAETNSDA